MVRKLNESRNLLYNGETYYKINYGGTWNHGYDTFTSETALRKFLETHVMEPYVQIIKCQDVTNQFKNSVKIGFWQDAKTQRGKDELNKNGITELDKYEGSSDD